MFVSNCSAEIQELLVNPNVTFQEVEEKIIEPYLKVMEDVNIPEDQKKAAMEGLGLADFSAPS